LCNHPCYIFELQIGHYSEHFEDKSAKGATQLVPDICTWWKFFYMVSYAYFVSAGIPNISTLAKDMLANTLSIVFEKPLYVWLPVSFEFNP
jgi:hypothetical protein